jgi:hypothetical protein
MRRDLAMRPGIPELLAHPYVTGTVSSPGVAEANTEGDAQANNAMLQSILQQVAAAGKGGQDAAAMAYAILDKLKNGEDVTGTFSSEDDTSGTRPDHMSEVSGEAAPTDSSTGSRAAEHPPPPLATEGARPNDSSQQARSETAAPGVLGLHEDIRNQARKLKPVASRPTPAVTAKNESSGTSIEELLRGRMKEVRKVTSHEQTCTVDLNVTDADMTW